MAIIETIGAKFGLVPKSEIKKVEERVRRNIAAKVRKKIEPVKKSSSWGKLFSIGQEWKLFGEEVTKPYEQIPSVYKAIKAIADNVPQADLKFRDKKSKKDIEDDEIIQLFDNPNPFMAETDFIQAWAGFLCLYGEAIVIKENSIGMATGGRRLPSELWPFNPKHFQEIKSGRSITGWRYTLEQILYKPEEVIFIKDFSPYDIFRGTSPMSAIDKIIDIDWKTLVFNKAFFDNNALPGLFLSSEEELGDEVIKRLKKQIEQSYKGANKAFKTMIFESGLKPQDVNPTHKDMDFIEQKNFTREEILGIWRAPKALFNITDDINYATFNGQMKIFWSYGIMPVMRKIEAAINRHLVWGYNPKIEAYFDYSNVVAYQEDFKEKVATGVQLAGMGFTRNEINERLQLGFEEVPWGDAWWAPFGLTPVKDSEPDEPAPDVAPKPDQEPAKSLFDKRKDAIWRGFISKQAGYESKMAGMISKYFFEQRKTALAALNESGAEHFKINWDEQDKKLKEKAEKWVYLAIKDGVEFGKAILGRKSIPDDILESKLTAYLVTRTDKITGINKTIQKQIKKSLTESLATGETIMQIADKFREIYNMASARSMMIARTETVGAVNGGSQLYYEAEGVKQKEWLTARDENVRESHRAIDGQRVLVGADFSNGLEFPGDQKGEPGECINCRCTILPVIE